MRRHAFLGIIWMTITLTTLPAEAQSIGFQLPWISSGSPDGTNDTLFWSALNQLQPNESFTLDPNPNSLGQPEYSVGMSFWNLNLTGVTNSGPPIYLSGGPTSTADFYIVLSLSFAYNPPPTNDYAVIAPDDYYGLLPYGYLRRIQDSSPCPLDGAPPIWCEIVPSGPYTSVQASEISGIPLVGGPGTGSGPDPTNNWVFHFSNVPRGNYSLHIKHDFTWYEGNSILFSVTNGLASGFSVGDAPLANSPPFCNIESPQSDILIALGSTVPINFRLNTDPLHVLSWKFFSVMADGQLLTNCFFNWSSQTTSIDGGIEWKPTSTGQKLIQLYGNDTSCENQDMAYGTNSLVVTVIDTNSTPIAHGLLTLQTNGIGKITPSYNGALLQIGKTYSVTAKTGKGFAFTGWTGSVVTNLPKLTFLMQSNLVLTANFVDVQRPLIATLFPKTKQRVTNVVLTAVGKAKDNVGVESVWYQFNDAAWTQAFTTNQWTNWNSDALFPLPGTNVFQAYAVDATGYTSLTNVISFVR